MIKTLFLALALLISSISFAGPKLNGKKKATKVSCSEVKGAKKDHFLWRGKISEKKKNKICKSAKKKRKNKKNTKKG